VLSLTTNLRFLTGVYLDLLFYWIYKQKFGLVASRAFIIRTSPPNIHTHTSYNSTVHIRRTPTSSATGRQHNWPCALAQSGGQLPVIRVARARPAGDRKRQISGGKWLAVRKRLRPHKSSLRYVQS